MVTLNGHLLWMWSSISHSRISLKYYLYQCIRSNYNSHIIIQLLTTRFHGWNGSVQSMHLNVVLAQLINSAPSKPETGSKFKRISGDWSKFWPPRRTTVHRNLRLALHNLIIPQAMRVLTLLWRKASSHSAVDTLNEIPKSSPTRSTEDAVAQEGHRGMLSPCSQYRVRAMRLRPELRTITTLRLWRLQN